MKRCTSPLSFKLISKQKCSKISSSSAFNESDDEVSDENRQCFINALEDTSSVSLRLKNDGNTLAEEGRYWEALSKFQEAIDLNLDLLFKLDREKSSHLYQETSEKLSVLYELCSQCYSELEEIYPAVEAAEKAIKCNSVCPINWQRLSRAQINIGELYLAKINMQRCIHLNPMLSDSWEELEYICGLIEQLKSKNLLPLPIITRPGIICQRK